MNLIMALIHPELYQNGQDVLERMRQRPDTAEWASQWTSVCSGISVICNRVSPLHKDRWSAPAWYDILAVLGDFEQCQLDLSELGAHFHYTKGTVLGFCGNVFKHSVSDWGLGDRVCYAQFMRRSTISHFTDNLAGWMTQEIFEEYLSQ